MRKLAYFGVLRGGRKQQFAQPLHGEGRPGRKAQQRVLEVGHVRLACSGSRFGGREESECFSEQVEEHWPHLLPVVPVRRTGGVSEGGTAE